VDLRDYKNKPAYVKNYWWFVGKRQFIDQLLRRYLGKGENRRILDVGCGVGDDLEIISRYGQVVVLDSDDETLRYIPDQYQKIRCEIQNLDWGEEKFDAAVLFDVLEHVENDSEALGKISQVLKPYGLVVILVPAGPGLWSPHDDYLGHYRRYTKKSLQQLAAHCGLTTYEVGYWNSLFFLPIALYRLAKRRQSPSLQGGSSDLLSLPGVVNQALTWVISLENLWRSRGRGLPWGLSLYTVLKKPY